MHVIQNPLTVNPLDLLDSVHHYESNHMHIVIPSMSELTLLK